VGCRILVRCVRACPVLQSNRPGSACLARAIGRPCGAGPPGLAQQGNSSICALRSSQIVGGPFFQILHRSAGTTRSRKPWPFGGSTISCNSFPSLLPAWPRSCRRATTSRFAYHFRAPFFSAAKNPLLLSKLCIGRLPFPGNPCTMSWRAPRMALSACCLRTSPRRFSFRRVGHIVNDLLQPQRRALFVGPAVVPSCIACATSIGAAGLIVGSLVLLAMVSYQNFWQLPLLLLPSLCTCTYLLYSLRRTRPAQCLIPPSHPLPRCGLWAGNSCRRGVYGVGGACRGVTAFQTLEITFNG